MSHQSNLPFAIDRSKPEQQGVTFYGDNALVQGGELNELQSIERNRSKRISNLIASDGDRVEGGEAIVDAAAQSVLLTSGKIYIAGDVIDVPAKTLAGVDMINRVEIGVKLVRSWITHEDDPELLGQVAGTLAEGESGAAREVATLAWALKSDNQLGEFFAVYLLQNGTILDQTPPPALDGITNAIATYDFSANGHYIVDGCRVTALGADGGNQVFSIEQGEANVHGIKVTRRVALRHFEAESFDVSAVPGETHIYAGGASETIVVNNFPIDQISSILLTKEKTTSITRGAIANGNDALPDNSIVDIISITQGGTTYIESTDFTLTSGNIDWALAANEPATGSTYSVTYQYRDSVVADSFDAKTITISGGVANGDIIIAYTWKLPRIDLLCLAQNGAPVYVKGISTLASKLPPATPVQLLKLAEIHNDWLGKPKVVNNGIYNYTYEEIDRMARAQSDLIRLTMLERTKSSIDAREPVAKRNMFVDPLIDDSLRDAGEVQSAAIGGGVMQLSISPTFYYAPLTAPVMLDYVEEIIISQELSTTCEKINPYQNFAPLPASMSIDPPVDFWTASETQWASPDTLEFHRGVRADGGPLEVITESINSLGVRDEQASFLRQIDLTATIIGFGVGEELTNLTFDGIDVKPAGTQAGDANGELSITFTIPSNIPTGSKTIIAISQTGNFATATFTGEGTIVVSTMQRVTSIERFTLPPVVQIINITNVTNNITNNITNNNGGGGWDPQAQTFTPPQSRQLIGIDFKLCDIGDVANNVLIHQTSVENGIPTNNIVAEAYVPMAAAQVGWVEARYNFPVLTLDNNEHAFIVKTDDGDHAVSVASLGDFDTDSDSFVSVHPYPVGVRLSSVNARTWTPHQKSSLTFRVVAAKYTSLTKIVALGSHDLVNCSDLQVRAAVELPDGACSVVFEVERPNGEIYRLLAGQVLQLNEYITETVELRAILTGTETLSPTLFAPVMLVAGELATSGTYITRAFDFGSAVRLTTYFKKFIPAGAGVSIEYDAADDNWQELPLISTEALAFPNWTEPKHEETGITADQGRLKITLTGNAGARPQLGDLGAAIF